MLHVFFNCAVTSEPVGELDQLLKLESVAWSLQVHLVQLRVVLGGITYLRLQYKMMTLGISQKLIATGSSRVTGYTVVVSALPFLIQVDCKCPEVCSCSVSAFQLYIQSKHASLDNCRWDVLCLSPESVGCPGRNDLGHTGIVINGRRQYSKENLNFKGKPLDKVCLHLDLLISVQRVKNYVLCLENMNAFFLIN